MVIMAANDCNAMATILVLTCPLLGSGLCSSIFLLNNICFILLKPLGTKPLPRRGQIKLRIAANAFHSIISVLSKASSHHHSTLQESRDTTRK
ncbi:hypothetical protein H5410_043779 [Solanum commersonii]|uniref:Uncharacterized protein n=1 Tax=Solanum commersonii TaxID=4109 RepID=A0A9J5XYI4_SOLCO|nr:hypothetical protein H5410_043779 [Solanum commersonii]